MALTLRRRGEIWHARGTVRIGRKTIHVAPFSTGCRTRGDAEAVVAAEEARIRDEHLAGPAGRARRLTIADCLADYLARPGGLQPWDVQRVADLNEAMGARRLDDAASAWTDWVRAHPRHAPATLARTRTTLAAALAYGAAAHGTVAPALPAVKQPRHAGTQVPILTATKREALIRAYNPHAACPALLLAELGLRTQEALRLDWLHVDLPREELRIIAAESKTGRGRPVPMTRRVVLLLWGMWESAGRPDEGPVFLSTRGSPYADTRGRGQRQQGGNPLAKAHATACRKAGVKGFRVHDWRHDWAARKIMAGVDMFTLCRLGGWSSLRMVQDRYGAVTAQHLREAARRVA